MSIIVDNVRSWEADIDRITRASFTGPALIAAHDADAETSEGGGLAKLSSPYVNELLKVAKALSSTSTSQPLLSATRVRELLRDSGLIAAAKDIVEPAAQPSVESEEEPTSEAGEELELDLSAAGKSQLEFEVEWLVVSKATAQVYGILLNTLLDQIVPLNDDIWYWDDILTSYTSLSLYTVQTSPLRLWRWAAGMKDVLSESRAKFRELRSDPARAFGSGTATLSQQWSEFYGIVRRSVADRSFRDIQRRILSPVARCRADAKSRQKHLKQLRQLIASGLGILVDEGLRFDLNEDADIEEMNVDHGKKWKGVVERSISLMDQVTKDVPMVWQSISEFEDRIFLGVQQDPISTANLNDAATPAALALRLDNLLARCIPQQVQGLNTMVKEYGRPPRLVRYWLPVGLLLLSSSTILRIVVRRREDIIDWIADFGKTVRDFWFNWVIEPVGKVIKTIRHDENSEIALMSRDSLRADRESLERMVVEFAVDRPQLAAPGSSALSESQIADIRIKVKEGDVTPVLRAYERDLKSPLAGTLRGDLVRSLLIQVQKTKVDLEVAISGIDSLLKSQELVFGFVGLTPGLLVSIGILQYARGVLGGRKGLRRGQKTGRVTRVLRNIDRIFFDAAAELRNTNGILSYKHRGLLICEVQVLRDITRGLFPGDVAKEFVEDVDDVLNGKSLEIQRQALERVRWAYAKWLK